MVRTLIASLAVSMTSIAMACDTCGCTASAHTHDAKAKASTCSTATASSCSGSTACTTAAVTKVSNDQNCQTECQTTCDGEKTSKVSLVSAMPKMTFRVGENDTCCPKTAATMAKEAGDHVHYVVNNVAFDSKADAMGAHMKALDTYMMDLVRIQYAVNGECVACPTAAKEMAASCESKKMQYKVGPASFESAEAAIAASVMAFNAAQKVSMEYAVGDEMTTCSVGAKNMAKKAECSVEYVVNGQRTNCAKTAGYLKTVASVESALKALETATGADA